MRLATITDGRVCVYEIDQAALSLDLKPKRRGFALKCFSRSASDTVMNFSDGITLRYFQLLTADRPMPTSAATAAVPPRASMMSSTELSMGEDSSRFVNLSRLHCGAVDWRKKTSPNNGMDSFADIGDRLRIWLLAKNMSAAKLCRLIDCEENEWSMFKKGDRRITLEIADQLCKEFGLTLDWIYRNDPRGMDEDLRIRMKEIRDGEAAAEAGAVHKN